MSNPHPTKSKPFKIGRKHTGAKREREKNGLLFYAKIIQAKAAKYKAKVAAYWRGDLGEFPKL